MGGGRVDFAIPRAVGSKILEECGHIVSTQGRLPKGKAVKTTGGNLLAGHAIHTVGPMWYWGANREAQIVGSSYKDSLKIAETKLTAYGGNAILLTEIPIIFSCHFIIVKTSYFNQNEPENIE
jgi:O-acetyl-ADP-ribose deacetylase (regulator of RNase III)